MLWEKMQRGGGISAGWYKVRLTWYFKNELALPQVRRLYLNGILKFKKCRALLFVFRAGLVCAAFRFEEWGRLPAGLQLFDSVFQLDNYIVKVRADNLFACLRNRSVDLALIQLNPCRRPVC